MAGKHTYGNKDLNEHAKKNVNSVVDFEDKKFTRHFSNKKFSNYFYIIESLKCINLCHSVHTDIEEKGIKYSASSPDEFALVNFAAEQGFQFEGKNENDIMQIRHGKHILKYKLLQLLEFSFERKRMSVIVQDLQTNQIIVYTKGADSKIHELIDKNWPHYQSHIDKSVEVLGKFSEKGLRTLCLSRRCLEIEEYEKWEKKYNEAKKSLDQDRKILIEELEEEIESKSILLGATAIEDKLQDDIDVTIDYFTQAGIKTWMITGDKTETAVKIGINCQLINPNSKIMILNNESDLEAHYEEAINYYKLESKKQKKKKLTDEEKLQQEAEKYQEKKPELVIVLNGVVFECLKKQKKLNEFGKVLINCQTVIACRVTPKEKQEFVSLIKRIQPSAVTLAIGDGANDVSMITEAHVGVGIQGIEGREASKAGDFAIGQFKYLKRLLFYVGQESYRKNSQLIFYNFYKNQSWILVGFVFGFFSGFSGQYIYDQLILQFYNVFFCSLPIILFAFFDETYPTSKFLQFPQNESNQLEFLPLKFKQNYEQQLYCQKNFWVNFFTATLHAILVTVITLLFLGGASPLQDQRQYDIYQIGMVIFTITVIFNNNRVFLYSHTHYFITIFCNVGSNFVYLGFLYYKSVQEESDSFGIFKIMYTSYNVYFAIIMSLVVTNLFDWGIDRYTLFFKQNPRYIQKEPVQEVHNKFLSLSPSKVGSSYVSSVVKSSQKFQKSGFFPANKQGLNTTLQSFSTQKFSIQNTSANSNRNINLLHNQNLAIKKAHSNNQQRQGRNYLNSGNEVQSDMTQKQQQNPQKSEFSILKSSAVQETKQENHINENDEQQYLEEIKDDNNTQKYPEIYIGNEIVLKRQRQINGKNINLNPDENNKSDYLYNNSNNYLQNNSEGSNPEKSVISNHSSDSRLGHTQMALNIENDSNIHLKNSEDKYDIVIKTNNSKKSKFKNQQ
ncbi:P-type ATPase, cytoplasmic domain N [Pseudocohnilembus persalinus]|uniref:Phospholipid-transporting ATPase n=1 Tax=Pseudocohnilembus persalinus TaxID=266149 RepID=A0A0V0QQR2_PSEPJ|nr:P-type ATPase, cytoplasmic domain N [Pseudocohnilembus persalinus]|eukprot:KRX04582.1 P-type ATPase, cytoplasmic domain N [Pseudocohnilembus persalinus]